MNEIVKKGFLYMCIFSFLPLVALGYTFEQNLTLGSTGADVTELQNILITEGYLRLPEGVAKGYFGVMTQEALRKYQLAKGIYPALGYFGPLTRAQLQMHIVKTPLQVDTISPHQGSQKTSNIVDQSFFFGTNLVTTSRKVPNITNVSVSKAKITDRITVTGENLGSVVTIYSSLGILKDKKVKNDQVIFNISEIIGNISELKGTPLTFSIGNRNGISLNYGFVVIE